MYAAPLQERGDQRQVIGSVEPPLAEAPAGAVAIGDFDAPRLGDGLHGPFIDHEGEAPASVVPGLARDPSAHRMAGLGGGLRVPLGGLIGRLGHRRPVALAVTTGDPAGHVLALTHPESTVRVALSSVRERRTNGRGGHNGRGIPRHKHSHGRNGDTDGHRAMHTGRRGRRGPRTRLQHIPVHESEQRGAGRARWVPFSCARSAPAHSGAAGEEWQQQRPDCERAVRNAWPLRHPRDRSPRARRSEDPTASGRDDSAARGHSA